MKEASAGRLFYCLLPPVAGLLPPIIPRPFRKEPHYHGLTTFEIGTAFAHQSMMMRIRLYFATCLLLCGFSWITPAHAGGPAVIGASGQPLKWQESVTLHPEAGTCGPLSNQQMLDLLQKAAQHWTNIVGINLNILIAPGAIQEDINVTNYLNYYWTENNPRGLNDGLSPIIFDHDGSITVQVGKSEEARTRITGMGAPVAFDSAFTEIREGQLFVNCACLENQSCASFNLTQLDLEATLTHELGHLLGIGHSTANEEMASQGCLDAACSGIPLMYPVKLSHTQIVQLTRDDEVAALKLYGTQQLQQTSCTVKGTLLDQNGTPMRCVDIQAITTDASKTLSAITGLYASTQDVNGDGITTALGECLGGCGEFELNGIDPNEEYELVIKPVNPQWVGDAKVFPCIDKQPVGIKEETLVKIPAGACPAGKLINLGVVETNSTYNQATRIETDVFGRPVGSQQAEEESAGCSLSRGFEQHRVREGRFLITALLILGTFLILRKRLDS